jgi:peptide/nickel transport system ATP-binding protein
MACDARVAPLLEVAELVVDAGAGATMRLPELALAPGEVAALFGPSGCGKSTLLAALFGLLGARELAVRGRVQCLGHDLLRADAAWRRLLLRERVAFLPQDAQAALDPLVAVGEQIEQASDRPAAAGVAMLAELGVADAAQVAARRPHAISGGQAQRALLAIAFLRAPALVVADEPSASLGGNSYDELLAHLRALVASGSALLLATHDARLLHDLRATVYAWHDGAFVRGAPAPTPWPRPAAEQLGPAVLAARGVRHAFGARAVVDGVDFACRRGEVAAIVGESGAGKTTLLRILAGHLRPEAGVVERPARRSAVQLVGQDAFASLTPGRPLADLLAEAHAPGFDPVAGARAVGLPAAALASPRERLSGGERRRAALLRALAVAPDALLLDEPTDALDRDTARHVLDTLLAEQRRRGLALVVVTHDREFAAAVAHTVWLLQGGRLCPA